MPKAPKQGSYLHFRFQPYLAIAVLVLALTGRDLPQLRDRPCCRVTGPRYHRTLAILKTLLTSKRLDI